MNGKCYDAVTAPPTLESGVYSLHHKGIHPLCPQFQHLANYRHHNPLLLILHHIHLHDLQDVQAYMLDMHLNYDRAHHTGSNVLQ